MKRSCLFFADRCLEIAYPSAFKGIVLFLFRTVMGPMDPTPDHYFVVEQTDAGGWLLHKDDELLGRAANQPAMANLLMSEVIYAMIDGVHSGVTLHGAAVARDGKGVWMPGISGAGKSSLTAWLVTRGYTYLTDELIHCPFDTLFFEAFTRPLNFKNYGVDVIYPLLPQGWRNSADGILVCDGVTLVAPELFARKQGQEKGASELALLLFPRFSTDEQPAIRALSPAQAGMRLMGCHVNARNLKEHGFPDIVKLCRQVPACELIFDSFARLEGVLDTCIDLLLHDGSVQTQLTRLTMLAHRGLAGSQDAASAQRNIPAPSPTCGSRKLTIGMATYDDYDGVYFSVQAIRLYHQEVWDDIEILVIDNNPGGSASQALKQLDSLGNYRYVPYDDRIGTAVREQVFAEAGSELVLCMDSHVLIEAGGLQRLLDYFDEHPDCCDLLQGVLLQEYGHTLCTHLRAEWREGMYGVWDYDNRAAAGEPFEIPMQGLGLFACRRDAWPGFHPEFKGFGGEEGYIHEKFRQQGGRTLCLPFLRWLHRFERPFGVRYPLNWEDRIWNYWIGFSELGLETGPIVEHFNDHLGRTITANILKKLGLQTDTMAAGPGE